MTAKALALTSSSELLEMRQEVDCLEFGSSARKEAENDYGGAGYLAGEVGLIPPRMDAKGITGDKDVAVSWMGFTEDAPWQ